MCRPQEEVAAGARSRDEAALGPALGPGSEGNQACEVAHVASVPVPCSLCGADDGESARLAFFDMVRCRAQRCA